jgi:2-oxoglutarate ferredoxin oxidoreductase subunit alpha
LVEVNDPSEDPTRTKLLVVGWGSTFGPIRASCRRMRKKGQAVAHAHLRHLNPFPSNLGEILASYDRVLIPENNLGHLLKLVRAEFLIDAKGYHKVSGAPFKAAELEAEVERHLAEIG